MSDIWPGLILIIGIIIVVGSVGHMSARKTGGYTAHNINEARLAQAQSQVDREAVSKFTSGCWTWVWVIIIFGIIFMVLQYSIGMAIQQCC